MRRRWIAAQAMLAAFASSGCQTASAPSTSAVALAITNVTVIDPETRSVQRGRSVYVDRGHIVAVVPSRDTASYAPARTVDGSDQYLIPGLMNMHAHLFLPEPPAITLNLMLANGVTGIREMSGDCWEQAGAKDGCIGAFRTIQRQVRSGKLAGPDLVAIASPMVMGPAFARAPEGAVSFIVPTSDEEARRLARYLKARGVDLIKTHDGIPKAVFAALGAEAKSLELEVSGHVPFGVPVTELAQHGFGSIEHARDLLYDCSRYGPEFRSAAGAFADGRAGAKRPDNESRMRRTVAEFEPERCQAVLATLARNGTFYVPTHVTREMDAKAGDPLYRNDPNRKYILSSRNAAWTKDLEDTAAAGAEMARLYDLFFRHGLKITGLAHKAGVPIMTGSDANDTMIVPGFSLHRELWLLSLAGLAPMDILRAATTVPAAYLGKSRSLGGISAGKEADLVLLRANPLSDIRATSGIAAVVTDGRLYGRAALDRMLEEAQAAAKAVPAPR